MFVEELNAVAEEELKLSASKTKLTQKYIQTSGFKHLSTTRFRYFVTNRKMYRFLIDDDVWSQ